MLLRTVHATIASEHRFSIATVVDMGNPRGLTKVRQKEYGPARAGAIPGLPCASLG